MESMLNKLRSTVSSVTSNAVSNAVSIANQVSNYLPGNPVTRHYEATMQIGSAGRGLMWKIYKGYKKSTKEEAAIFLFEKRQLDKFDRLEREGMLDKIKKGVSQLTRLRHPQVLTVQHPLEESRDTLAFATEPCLASLANVLGHHENLPSPVPNNLIEFEFYDVEIKYGLLQLSEGLSFLHNSVKIIHRSISPENIILNQQGAWKLFGFEFCLMCTSTPDQPSTWPFEPYDSKTPEFAQPDLDYIGPEYCLSHTIDPSADIFSLGVLTYCLYNKGQPIFKNHGDFLSFRRRADDFKKPGLLQLPNIPSTFVNEVRSMLNASPDLRPDANLISKMKFFDDLGVKTLSYLDQLFHWDNMQKSQFYKSLPQILSQFPHRVALLRIVPCLNKECVNPTMIPFVLPVILQVAETANREEFVDHILPILKPIMKISEPIQIMLNLMMKMELLLSKTPANDICTNTLPLLYRALECNTQQIQELCLSILPTCAPLVDASTMKNALLPRVKKLCNTTGYLSVRVNCLVCIGKVLEHLDKWLVFDEVFPFLTQIPSKEAPVIMAMVGIYKTALCHKKLGISKEVLAVNVLPFLIPLSIENSLTSIQHQSLVALIKQMMEKVEEEHKAKLKHLDSIRTEQKSLEMSMPFMPSNSINSPQSVKTEIGDAFSSYELNPTEVKPICAENGTLTKTEDRSRVGHLVSSSSLTSPVISPPPSVSNPIKSSSMNFNSPESKLMNSNLNNLGHTTAFTPRYNLQSSSHANSSNSFVLNPPMNRPPIVPSAPFPNHFTPMNRFQSPLVPNATPAPLNAGIGSNPEQFSMRTSQSLHSMSQPLIPLPKAAGQTGAIGQTGFKPLSSSDINEFLK